MIAGPSSCVAVLLAALWCADATSPVRAQGEDCRTWEFEGGVNPPTSSGLKLGMERASIGRAHKRSEKAASTRYFDALRVNTYGAEGYVIETVSCDAGRELVVGVHAAADFIIQQRPMAGWIAEQRANLARSGVRDIVETHEGQDRILWGVKTRVPAHAGGTADYLVLRRWCRMTVDKGVRMCGWSGAQVHSLRSRDVSR